jgi:hypothetical protein
MNCRVVVKESQLTGNRAQYGGALPVASVDLRGSLTLNNTALVANQASFGAGLWYDLYDASAVVVTNSSCVGNSAGAIRLLCGCLSMCLSV